MADELKPCQCGLEPRLSVRGGVTGRAVKTTWQRAYVFCKCGMRTETQTTKHKAITIWNRRTPTPSTDGGE